MYALKRITAYAIDAAIAFAPMFLLTEFGKYLFNSEESHGFHSMAILGSMGFSFVWPVLFNGILTGLTGRTPGKFILALNVKDGGGDPPGIPQGILRELIKVISLGFMLGMLWALQGVVTRGQTFYDQWLDLDVEDLKPYGLSETQKNWRKYHREQARKNRR
jgi:uncharacterized RDD family membrane protein YckC